MKTISSGKAVAILDANGYVSIDLPVVADGTAVFVVVDKVDVVPIGEAVADGALQSRLYISSACSGLASGEMDMVERLDVLEANAAFRSIGRCEAVAFDGDGNAVAAWSYDDGSQADTVVGAVVRGNASGSLARINLYLWRNGFKYVPVAARCVVSYSRVSLTPAEQALLVSAMACG
jgi:hypothetical protein